MLRCWIMDVGFYQCNLLMIPLYIILTAFTAQFIYIIVNWYYFRRSEYLYYSIYIIVLSLYFFNRYIGDDQGMICLGIFSVFKMYPDRILAILSYIYYFKFGRHFVEAKTRYPGIQKIMTKAERFLFVYIGLVIVLFMTTGYSRFESALFVPVNAGIFLVLGYVFLTMLKKREALDKFILTGSMFYGISALITLLLGLGKSPLENDHMLPLQIGALVEMAFLNAGLVYKSRMLQAQTVESQNQLIRRYRENQELAIRLEQVRERISRDLHDDVGATLSSIKTYSEILKINPTDKHIAELINANSAEMIENLEVIAWSTNPVHDNFGSLQHQMRRFATPLLYSKNIHFKFSVSGIGDATQIPGEIRQNIFLVFKEAVNNIHKYAQASECTVRVWTENHRFHFEVADNGRGFDQQKVQPGNGLLNMKKRIEELGGNITLTSEPGMGTRLKYDIPFSFHIPDSWDRSDM